MLFEGLMGISLVRTGAVWVKSGAEGIFGKELKLRVMVPSGFGMIWRYWYGSTMGGDG